MTSKNFVRFHNEDGAEYNFSQRFQIRELQETIANADVVILRNSEDPVHMTCVYGRALLAKVIERNLSAKVALCAIPIDFSPECQDLELVLSIVAVAKGHHEYQVSDDNDYEEDEAY